MLLSGVLVASVLFMQRNYDENDPSADHKQHAIKMDEAGRIDRAVESFRAAVRFHPSSTSAWNNLGVALAESVAAEEEGEDVDPTSPSVAGAMYEAAHCFNNALRADPENRGAKEELKAIASVLLRPAGRITGLGEDEKHRFAKEALPLGEVATYAKEVNRHAKYAGSTAKPHVQWPKGEEPLHQYELVANTQEKSGEWDFAAVEAALYDLVDNIVAPDDSILELCPNMDLPRGFNSSKASSTRRLVTLVPYALDGTDAPPMPVQNTVVHWDFNQPDRPTLLPFASASFDAVFCSAGVHRMVNPLQVFDEARRVTKPDGKAFVISSSADAGSSHVSSLWAGLDVTGRPWFQGALLSYSGFEDNNLETLSIGGFEGILAHAFAPPAEEEEGEEEREEGDGESESEGEL
jgi:SAM-dependent methyltransferase